MLKVERSAWHLVLVCLARWQYPVENNIVEAQLMFEQCKWILKYYLKVKNVTEVQRHRGSGHQQSVAILTALAELSNFSPCLPNSQGFLSYYSLPTPL
jgi:hypothetical protein